MGAATLAKFASVENILLVVVAVVVVAANEPPEVESIDPAAAPPVAYIAAPAIAILARSLGGAHMVRFFSSRLVKSVHSQR